MRMTKKVLAFVMAGVIISTAMFGSAEASKALADMDVAATGIGDQTNRQEQSVTEVVEDSDFAEAYTIRPLSTSAESSNADDFNYEEKDDGIYITKYLGSATSVIIPAEIDGKKVVGIGDRAFFWCSRLTSIMIPDSVTQIGDDVFWFCSSLTSITIPDSVTQIGDNAFYNCSSLTSITIPDGITEIGDSTFYNCSSLTNTTIPDSVTTISYQAFYDCSSLSYIKIPSSVTKIDRAFDYCSNLREIDVDESNNNYKSVDGILYNKDCSELICCPGGKAVPVTIPNSVLKIGDYAFYCCSSLTSIMIPDSVTQIGGAAFSGCSSLASITIPDSVTQMGDSAFSWCDSLTSVTIPNSVTKIGVEAFSGCGSLASITIPDSVTQIGDSAFSWCDSLTSITIPDNVTQIGGFAFDGCDSLTSITMPDSVTEVGDDAFYGTAYCKNDENWEGDVLYLGKHLIMARNNVSSAYEIKAGTKTIGNYAFVDSELESVVIPDSVTQIAYGAFSGSSSLTSIVIPDGVRKIDSAFQETGYMKEESNWENGALYIGNHLIAVRSDASPDYIIKEGTKTIAGSALDYYYDVDLTSVTIPDSVSYIGTGGRRCLSDMLVYYEGTPEQWAQIVIDESQGIPKEVVFTKSSISYGDATGDQTIDMKDVVLLRKYMAEFDYDSNTSTVAVEAGGDVNGDGIFDMKDVVLLRKYIADFDYDTGTSDVVLGP